MVLDESDKMLPEFILKRLFLKILCLQPAFQLRVAVRAGIAAAHLFNCPFAADRACVADFRADGDVR